MKKYISILLALILCLTSMPGITAFAEGEDQPDIPEDVNPLTEDYQEKLFADLYEDGDFILPDLITAKASEEGNGVLLSVESATYFKDARFQIRGSGEDGKFDFDGNTVARLTIDGLSSRKTKAMVNFFIDDEEEPFATIQLKVQPKEDAWTREGKISQTILEKNIKGEHAVSFTIDLEVPDETKGASVLLRSIEFAEGSIPVMDFHIDESLGSIAEMNTSEDHTAECYGDVDILVPSEFECEFTDNAESVKGLDMEYIRGRGNSTWDVAGKKPYKIKFMDKQDILGMGANRHWVLLANRFDNTLSRNRMTYWLTRKLGEDTGVFAPECVPVEVVMNGTYYGSYLLTEQIRVDKKTRVPVDDLDDKATRTLSDPEDPAITGGYLLSRDFGSDDDDHGIITFRNEGFFIESPDFEKHTDKAKAAQKEYIEKYLNTVENAIYGDDFKDPAGHSYTEYMDIDSAADFWWIQEFSENGDAFTNGSTYLYKPRNGKLIWGPLWDFDYVAWGDLLYDSDPEETFDYTSFTWFTRLRTDPAFIEKLKERWKKIDSLLEEITRKDGILDQYAEEICISEQYDQELWGFYSEGYGDDYDDDGYIDAEQEEPEDAEEESETPEITFEYEIEFLRNWIEKRRAWVNSEGNLDNLTPKKYKVDYVADGKVLETRYLYDGSKYAPFPKAPEKKGYTCFGWSDEYDDMLDEDSVVTVEDNEVDSIVLTAFYVKNSDLTPIRDIFFRDKDVYMNLEDLEFGSLIDFNYTTIPEFGIGEIKWSSSDESVVRINEEGDPVTAGIGTAEVTATLPNGKKKSFTAHILSDPDELNYMEEFFFEKSSVTVTTGGYAQVVLRQEPQPCLSGYFKWISTDPEVVTVDENGVITAHKAGTSYIVVYDPESSDFVSCKVTVKMNKAEKIAMAKKAKTSLKAKALKGGKAKLTWKKAKGVSGYYIFRAEKKNGKYKKVKAVKKAGTKKWTDSKLKKGKNYFYKIRPFTKISGKTYKGKMSKAVKVKAK